MQRLSNMFRSHERPAGVMMTAIAWQVSTKKLIFPYPTVDSMPPHLRALLLRHFGSAIDEVKIVEYSWINALHFWPQAVTRRRRIYLRWSAARFFADTDLVLHEYFHVLRQWRTGRLTVLRYILMSMRYGYWKNPYEVHARRFAALHSGRRPALYKK